MQKFLERFKRDDGGFSILELIIYIAILAVICAFMIPTMLGFVRSAEGKANIACARTSYLAAQVISTEQSAYGQADADIVKMITMTNEQFAGLVGPEVVGSGSDVATVSATVSGGAVTTLTYTRGGYAVTITPGESAVVTEVSG